MGEAMSHALWLGVSALALVGSGGSQAASQATIPAAPAARVPLPVEAFADIPEVEAPEISPNGKQIVAKVAIQGRQLLAVLTPGTPGLPKLLNPGKADLNWWRWVNDEWVIVGIGQEAPIGADNWYITRALAFHVPTGKVTRIASQDAAQNGDNVIWAARDGAARVMLSYQTSIFWGAPGFWPQVDEVDLDTGKRRVVVPSRTGVWNWYADGAGVVRMGFGMSEDGRSRRILYREKPNMLFRVIDKSRTREDRLTVPALFLNDSSKALVFDDDEGGYRAVYEFDLTTLERGKQLFGSKGYDIGGLIPDSTGFGYLGVGLQEAQGRVNWTDPDMAAMQTTVSGLVKGARVGISSLNRDRSRVLLAFGGADTPGGYFIYNRPDKTMQLLGYHNRAIKMRRMHPVSTIRYKARDGLEIEAVLTVPAGRKDKLPLIVMPHGGPFARDSETWDWWTQFMADRGYVVVQPNYRGSSGYGRQFAKKGEGEWGLAMQDDLNDAVKALADQGIADPARVCMVGASYGGYAAMRAAQRDGKQYRCAVSYAGVSDLNRMIRHQRNFLGSGAQQDWLRDQAPDLKNVSPLNFPEQFSIPILLVHGNEDRVVPPVHSKMMAQKLKAAGKDVTYIVQPEADHHFSRTEDRLEFLKALEAFLAKHNPA